MQGIIKKIIGEKKCGFISVDGADKDVFFHSEKLDGVNFEDLKEGDVVTFETQDGDRGPVAVGVKKS